MGLVLGLLALCALDPEDCALIPGIGETLADQSALLGGLFGFLLFVNLIMTLQVMKLCKKHNLDGKATNMWLGQTLISGVFSWKALKDADDQVEGRRAGGSSVDGASGGTGKKSPKKGK
uniref:Uncharacterized protein n=1 Tax=Strigamia maritima TaxID=126957 RepID=T1J3K0_STRMM